MSVKLKSHRLSVEEESDDSGEVTIFKHYMTVVLEKGDTDILIARNEYTGEITCYYVESDGYEAESSDDELLDVADWMEDVTGQPLDERDGWDALPTV